MITPVRPDFGAADPGPFSGPVSGDRPAVGAASKTTGLRGQAAGRDAQSEYSAATPVRPPRHFNTPIWQTSQQGGFFGMMGEIVSPGVYAHPQERVTLGEVLKMAGGPTANTSGSVRIVRQGRAGLQTFLSLDSRYELLNGDVVIVDSRNGRNQPGLRKFSGKMQTVSSSLPRGGGPAEGNARQVAPPAYLAFVNLTAEPIIVPVPADQDTLPAVMAWLRQDPKAPPSVRVISPTLHVRPDNSIPPDEQLLESGTVLVFDPSTVKQDRLPAFPPPRRTDGAQVAPAAAATTPRSPASTDHRLPAVLPGDRPAGTLRRAMPSTVPAPPAEPKMKTIPRKGSSPHAAMERSDLRSTNGGPELMPPQNRHRGMPQATVPEFKSRPATHPADLKQEPNLETTSASFEGRQLGWDARTAEEEIIPAEEFGEQGIVQAHGVAGPNNDTDQIGPSLELPNPEPERVEAPALIPAPVNQSSDNAPVRNGSVLLRMIWGSLTGLLILAGCVWGLARWDRRPQLVPRRVLARATPPSSFNTPFRVQDRNVTLSERLPIRRTDLKGMSGQLSRPEPTIGPQPSGPLMPKPALEPEPMVVDEPPLPPPLRSISEREHALRAHFRQARQERSKRPAGAVESPGEVDPPVRQPLEIPLPSADSVVRPPAFHTNKASDALARALHAKRGNITPD